MRKTHFLFVLPIALTLAISVSAQKPGSAKAPTKSYSAHKNLKKPISFAAAGLADKDGWKVYTSGDDNFKIAFPPTPVAIDETDSAGEKIGRRYYNPEPVTPARVSLTAGVADLP